MRALSGGMKRRVLVGQALVHKPPVIVLDEPTAGVDVELRQSLWAFIRKLNRDGHTIILTTHYLEEAEALCGRIAMLKSGRVVALDTTHNLLSSFAGLTVRLTVDALPEAWADRVQRHEANTYLLTLADHAELERLLASLRERGIAIGDAVAAGSRSRAGVPAHHEACGMSATGRPEREYRSAQREGNPMSGKRGRSPLSAKVIH